MRYTCFVLVILFFIGGCEKVLTVWVDDQVIESVATGKSPIQYLKAQLKTGTDQNCETIKQLVVGVIRDYFRVANEAHCNSKNDLLITTSVTLMHSEKNQPQKQVIDGLANSKEKGFIFFLATETEQGFSAIVPAIALSRLYALNNRLMGLARDIPRATPEDLLINEKSFSIFIELRNTLEQDLPVHARSVYVNDEPFPVAEMTLIKPGATATVRISQILNDAIFVKGSAFAPIIEFSRMRKK